MSINGYRTGNELLLLVVNMLEVKLLEENTVPAQRYSSLFGYLT